MRRMIALATLLVATPFLGAWLQSEDTPPDQQRILGLWTAFQPIKEGDPVRFYYFHNGGIGLYRYGRMGLTYTQAFSYQVGTDGLVLRFLQSGDVHRVAYQFDDDTLSLAKDPMMGGKRSYTKSPSASHHFPEGLMTDHPFARMWKHDIKTADGRTEFALYQLQAPALDGRGVGWYHEGDMRAWSTEALNYRKTAHDLLLSFPLRGDTHTSRLTMESEPRAFVLDSDPRGYWHPRRFMDAGPGFTFLLDDEPMPYHIPGHGQAGHPTRAAPKKTSKPAKQCPYE